MEAKAVYIMNMTLRKLKMLSTKISVRTRFNVKIENTFTHLNTVLVLIFPRLNCRVFRKLTKS